MTPDIGDLVIYMGHVGIVLDRRYVAWLVGYASAVNGYKLWVVS